MRMPAGDHDAGRRAAAVAIVDGGGRRDVVVDVDVVGRQAKKSSSLQRSNGALLGLPQRLADVDVLALNPVLATARSTSSSSSSVPKLTA